MDWNERRIQGPERPKQIDIRTTACGSACVPCIEDQLAPASFSQLGFRGDSSRDDSKRRLGTCRACVDVDVVVHSKPRTTSRRLVSILPGASSSATGAWVARRATVGLPY